MAKQLYHSVIWDEAMQGRLTARAETTAAAADELARLSRLDGQQENRKGLTQQGSLDRKGIRYVFAK